MLEAALDAAEHLGTRRRLHGVALPFERAPLREPFGGAPLDAAGRALLADPGPGIFVDPLHFDPPFLVHLGALTGSPDLVDAGAAQAVALVELLQDDSGAFWHFFLERTGSRYGLGWGRGQGWALLGLVDVLECLPSAHPGREPLVSALIRLADALCATQQRRRQLVRRHLRPRLGPGELDRRLRGRRPGPRRGPRACSSPVISTRRGLRGRAPPPAWPPSGALEGVSANVWACTAPWHYANVPLGAMVPWGQGPLLLAAAEHLGKEEGS